MERKIIHKKSLIITEDFIKKINKIYKTIKQSPSFTLITKDDAKYEFDSIKKLLLYDFNEEIKRLIIENKEKDENENIIFIFEVVSKGILNYSYTSICKYTTKSNDTDIVLKHKILDLYKSSSKSDWIIGKIGLFFMFEIIILISALIFLIIALLKDYPMLKQVIQYKDMIHFFFGILTGITITIIRIPVDRFIGNKFFIPIEYELGLQKNKVKRKKIINDNIFWSVIVGILVSIISSIIYDKLF